MGAGIPAVELAVEGCQSREKAATYASPNVLNASVARKSKSLLFQIMPTKRLPGTRPWWCSLRTPPELFPSPWMPW
ncbi:hypothetical protein AUK22_04100 [bacterium CG2_30_54_10]|nr:MAG: hypothetical protein AUK22_04100 [bacterium CG2_30_54_10]